MFLSFFSFSDQRHGNSTVFDHPIIGFDDPQNGRNNNKPLEKETNLSTQEQKGPVSSNSEISSSSSTGYVNSICYTLKSQMAN